MINNLSTMIITNTTLKKAEIQDLLVKNGFMQIYPLKNGKLMVKASDAVQVTIQKNDTEIKIESKFPTIGNPVQVIATIFFVGLLIYLSANEIFSIPFPFLVGVALGQGVSYMWFLPKIKILQNQVFSILNESNTV